MSVSTRSAEPVWRDGWYLGRPGFALGGIRVAACWAGAVHALVTTLRRDLAGRPQPDPIRAVNLGRADIADWTAQLALDHAARVFDGGATGAGATLLAERTRAVVAEAAEVVLREVGHALGPAPLAFDEVHARRVSDLTLYVRQHHAERDWPSSVGWARREALWRRRRRAGAMAQPTLVDDGAVARFLPPRDTHLVVLAAHPDDETLGVGC